MGEAGGCCVLILLMILFPFFGGIIAAFAVGGWMLGVGAILYTVLAFWGCSRLPDGKAGCCWLILMLPLEILQFAALLNGMSKGGI